MSRMLNDGRYWLLLCGAMAAGWVVLVLVNRIRVRHCDGTGDPTAGIVVFVEPVRWLFVIWGFAPVCRGLRRAGLDCRVHLFRWSRWAGSLFVLPDLMRRRRLDTNAKRLQRFCEALAREHPTVPVHLIGYSTGAYLAFEAVKNMSPAVRIGTVTALHASVSPAYAMAPVVDRARRVFAVHGIGDWLINGLGTLLFGTNDRRHAPACGFVGADWSPTHIEQHAWGLGDVRDGYVGGHFTVVSPRWIARHVAPRLR